MSKGRLKRSLNRLAPALIATICFFYKWQFSSFLIDFLTDEFVGSAPAFKGGRDVGVTVTVGSGEERGGQSSIQLGVVAVQVSLEGKRVRKKEGTSSKKSFSRWENGVISYFTERKQVVTLHDVLAQDHGQVFVVGDLLDHGSDDATGFLFAFFFFLPWEQQFSLVFFVSSRSRKFYLVETFVIPLRVDLSQLGGNAVVFTQHKNVLSGQHGLLVDTEITCQHNGQIKNQERRKEC